MAEALTMHEDSLCPGCNQPREHAWDPRSEGEYDVTTVTCQACAARDSGSDDKKKPGQYRLVHRAT